MSCTQQADSGTHEQHHLSFLVSVLTEGFELNLGNNADIDPDYLFEVLVGTSADGNSTSDLYENSEDLPASTDIVFAQNSGITT